MSMLRFKCPRCGLAFNARSGSLGTMQRCKNCGTRYVLKRGSGGVIAAAVGLGLLVVCCLFCGGLSSIFGGGRHATTSDDKVAILPPRAMATEGEARPSPSRPSAVVTPARAVPAARPAVTAPTTRQTLSVAAARAKLAAAERVVAGRILKDAAYLAARADADRLKALLDDALKLDAPVSQMNARDAWGAARAKVDRLWAEAVGADPDVRLARAAVAAATAVQPAPAPAAVAAQPSPAADPVASADPPATSGVGDPAPGGYGRSGGTPGNGGPKDVEVKGYTRKDGTHVAPYSRSSPGSGSGSRGGHK